MTISKKKLAIIAKLNFLKTLKKLKTYLKFTNWFRNYVSYYVQIAEPLQQRKTLLLKNESIKKNSRKSYSKRITLSKSTNFEYDAYEYLQHTFNQFRFLIHFVIFRFLFIDVNVFKQWKFDAMIFHVKSDLEEKNVFDRKKIQSIMFLNKQLFETENRYWLIEFEIIEVVWMAKKIRHMIESCRKSSTTIFIDHSATVDIVKQTFLTIENTEKLNFRLMKTSQYFSTLSIKIKVKSKKFHMMSNVLSRLKLKYSKKKNRFRLR